MFPRVPMSLLRLSAIMLLSLGTTLAIVGLVVSCAPLVGIVVRAISKRRRPLSPPESNSACLEP